MFRDGPEGHTAETQGLSTVMNHSSFKQAEIIRKIFPGISSSKESLTEKESAVFTERTD